MMLDLMLIGGCAYLIYRINMAVKEKALESAKPSGTAQKRRVVVGHINVEGTSEAKMKTIGWLKQYGFQKERVMALKFAEHTKRFSELPEQTKRAAISCFESGCMHGPDALDYVMKNAELAATDRLWFVLINHGKMEYVEGQKPDLSLYCFVGPSPEKFQ